MRARDFRSVSMAVQALRQYQGTQIVKPIDIICVLDEDLEAADHSKKPKSAKARIMWWDYDLNQYMEKADYLGPGEELTEEEIEQEQIEVWNFSEAKEYDEDTFGFADWKEPHFWFHGDCEAMPERKAPDPEE